MDCGDSRGEMHPSSMHPISMDLDELLDALRNVHVAVRVDPRHVTRAEPLRAQLDATDEPLGLRHRYEHLRVCVGPVLVPEHHLRTSYE